ncbi:MAG TPA: phosphate ABC transporter permease subunit PstC [Mycobacteriales bacterium]|nr:phosphate ABC transporter permease subunit PstC [Mycobacteriales bacterium]
MGRSQRRGDQVFKAITLSAGLFVFVLLAAIAVFLITKAAPALQHDHTNFLTTKQFNAADPTSFGIAALAFGTLLTAALALLMAVPVAFGVALFITEYAPRRIATLLGYASDLLAAVPSVIYGLWAAFFLLGHLIGLQHFLSTYFGWIPLFSDPGGQALTYSKSVFGAAVILAVMILPIVAAISREVFRQIDPAQKEAALALGATRWEMIRTAVLPASRPGMVSAVMLGLGRALGETIAVALVIGNVTSINWHILIPGGSTIAANIANQFGEASALGRSALIASGLVLFALTLVVNFIARTVIARSGTRETSAAV